MFSYGKLIWAKIWLLSFTFIVLFFVKPIVPVTTEGLTPHNIQQLLQLFYLESCKEPPCGPTNILLELMARNRKRCQANKNLINSTFRWEPDTTGLIYWFSLKHTLSSTWSLINKEMQYAEKLKAILSGHVVDVIIGSFSVPACSCLQAAV